MASRFLQVLARDEGGMRLVEAKEALGKMKKFLPVMLINQGSAVAE